MSNMRKTSLVKLRAVRHRAAAKVRDHVALCMLALYIQPEITAKLDKVGMAAASALALSDAARLSVLCNISPRARPLLHSRDSIRACPCSRLP